MIHRLLVVVLLLVLTRPALALDLSELSAHEMVRVTGEMKKLARLEKKLSRCWGGEVKVKVDWRTFPVPEAYAGLWAEQVAVGCQRAVRHIVEACKELKRRKMVSARAARVGKLKRVRCHHSKTWTVSQVALVTPDAVKARAPQHEGTISIGYSRPRFSEEFADQVEGVLASLGESPGAANKPVPDEQKVITVLHTRQAAWQLCYREALARNAKIKGSVEVHFTIKEGGRVSKTRIEGPPLGDAALKACILHVTETTRFPGLAETPVDIAVPLNFAPKQVAGGKATRSTKPKVLKRVLPRYPDALRAHGVQGQVALTLQISQTGQVLDAAPISSPHKLLTRAAIDAARQMKFAPATLNGKAVAVNILYRFTFVPDDAK